MQQTPVRILFALRPDVPPALLLGSAVSTVVFSATPFLLPAIAEDFGRSLGTVGLISTAQLGGFVLAAWGAGRLMRPRRRLLVVAALLGAVVNVVSAFTPWFSLLLVARFLSGVAIGLIDWISWSEVFGDQRRVGTVAVMGPIVGTVAAPVLAVVTDVRGPTVLFLLLAVLHLVPLALVRGTVFRGSARPPGPRHRPTRAATVILASLGAMTLGGSSVFVYAAAIAFGRTGMSALAVSLAFSANALAGIPSARVRGRRGLAGAWVLITAVMVAAVAAIHVPAVFVVAMALWGFAFWMGVPAAYNLLASRSRYPEERAGDAQAIMALGRVVGPLLGGVLVASPNALGLLAAGLVVAAGIGLLVAELAMPPVAPTEQVHTAV